ncbi:heavy-metal-associated domain-containing protein [Haloarchaeobius amylolyticus]|uniref:Heavy-metal-associated domain-containing protein n=1 Tax=Haloarchaeobius amylolyticus TaxID=1198296 RepID=A0ABD6BKF3_9EURY
MDRTTLTVRELSDIDGERTVTTALESFERVAAARADHERDEIRVEHDASTVDAASLAKMIEDAGYSVDE